LNNNHLKESHADLDDVAKKLRDKETKLEISWTSFENKRKRVIVGEDVYQDVKLDY
jgi:hypothetical protein